MTLNRLPSDSGRAYGRPRSTPADPPGPMDLLSCELEPIRFPGAVQPHGALLVLSTDAGRIEAASESCGGILGVQAVDLLGSEPALLIGSDTLASLLPTAGVPNAPAQTLAIGGTTLVMTLSRNTAGQYLIDIEMGGVEAASAGYQAWQQRNDLDQLRGKARVEDVTRCAAECVQRRTGFDRVMIYRFDPDWNGEVVAEACATGVTPYLGLNFPASDIPRQARELFQNSGVRLIADVDYRPSALLATGDSRAVDLGGSVLRSVSPLHVEYLQNMGVKATLVGSLVVEGRLWGLIACHHLSGPRHCSPGDRHAVGWFCKDVAAHLGEILLRDRQLRVATLTARRRALVDRLRRIDFKTIISAGDTDDLLAVVAADGFALIEGRACLLAGRTPPPHRVKRLLELRRQSHADPTLYATHAIATDLEGDADDGDIAGAMFVSLQNKPHSTLIWFREERRYSVSWAGDPRHPHTVDQDGRISPRKSFALFLDAICGQSIQWSEEERASAVDLASLIEIEALRKGEAFLRTVLDSSPEHVCVLDQHGVIVAINGAWQRFGRENGAAESAYNPVGQSYRSICSAAIVDDVEEASPAWKGIKAVLDGELEFFTLDYPCHSPEQRRWFAMSVYPMRAPCEGAVVTHADVTHRVLGELQLIASEERYRGLLEDQTELICRFRADGTILYLNDAFLRFFGKRRELMVGYRWQPVTVPEDLPAVMRALEALSPQRPIVTIENRVFSAGNVVRWTQFVNRGFFDEANRLIEVQAVGRDITDQKEAQQKVLLQSEKNHALLLNASDAVAILDREGYLLECSDSFCVALGYQPSEVRGLHLSQWDTRFSDSTRGGMTLREQFTRHTRSFLETRHRRKDGGCFDVETSAFPLEIDGVAMLFCSSRDISERKRIDDERLAVLDLMTRISRLVPGVLFQYRLRPDGRASFPYASASIKNICQLLLPDIEEDATAFVQRLHPEDRAIVTESMQRSARELLPWRQEYRIQFDDGTVRWLLGDAIPQQEPDGVVILCGVMTDISEGKLSEAAMKNLAFFDPLTHLPNRTLLEDRLERAMAASQRSGKCAALAVLDLDNFKPLNDQFGHAAGDLMLREVARRLGLVVRGVDTVGRSGGDEFQLVLAELEFGLAESFNRAGEVCERLRATLAMPYILGAGADAQMPERLEHHSTSSIGFVVFRGGGASKAGVIAQADAAMYRAKALGRNAVIGVIAASESGAEVAL